MRRTQLKFARHVIYNLKRRYGVPVDLYRIVNVGVNDETGRTTTTKLKYRVRKMVQLPSNLISNMGIAGQYKNPSPNFPAQDLDIENTKFILDQRDVPDDFQLSSSDYFIVKRQVNREDQIGRRFNIMKFTEIEDGIGYYIEARYIIGGQRNEVFDTMISEQLPLTIGVDKTLSYIKDVSEVLTLGEQWQ